MNKLEFMQQLDAALINLPYEDRADIINDYEEHFRLGLENNKTEAEICENLGCPNELAAGFYENYNAQNPDCEASPPSPNQNSQQTYQSQQPQQPEQERSKLFSFIPFPKTPIEKILYIVIGAFLAVTVVLPAASALIGLWVGLLGTTIGIIAAGFALIVVSFFLAENVLLLLGILFLGIGFVAGGILLIFATSKVAKGFVWMIKQIVAYVKKFLQDTPA